MRKMIMKRENRVKRICLMLALFLTLSFGMAFAQGNGSLVSLDQVDGLVDGKIPCDLGTDVVFHFGYTNGDGANKVMGMTNGYELYATGGATWTNGAYGDEFSWGPAWHHFDLFWSAHLFSWDGAGYDTVGFGGSVIVGQGLPPGYSGPAVFITVNFGVQPASDGETFCIDSCYYPPVFTWMWSYGGMVGSFPPDWQGPHCFEIVSASCCVGMRGNVNNDPGDAIDISDLVYQVDYMFNSGPQPTCAEEANINGSCCASGSSESLSDIDISDLVYLVDYMFNQGPPPPSCP